MARNRGQIFEDQLEKSIPAGVYIRKLHTPAPPASRVDAVIGLLQRLSKLTGQDVGWAIPVLNQSRFTARSPYDHIIIAPAERRAADIGDRIAIATPVDDGSAVLPLLMGELRDPLGLGLVEMLVQPSVIFTVECKCAGTAKSLPFAALQDHQEEGLVDAAAMGYVSGLLIEFPDVGPEGEVFFMPITSYVAYKAQAGRASLPLDACRDFGLLIEVDPGRGRVHRYWRMGNFLRRFGAAIPGAPEEERPVKGGRLDVARAGELHRARSLFDR